VGVDILGKLLFTPFFPSPISTTITPSPQSRLLGRPVFGELKELKGEAWECLQKRWRKGCGHGGKYRKLNG